MTCWDWTDEEWPDALEPLQQRVDKARTAPTYTRIDLLFPLIGLLAILGAWL